MCTQDINSNYKFYNKLIIIVHNTIPKINNGDFILVFFDTQFYRAYIYALNM